LRESQHHFGVDTLARNKDVHWTLELVGDGPLRREIEQLTAQLGLLDRVQFTGTRRDVPERLAKAQILALISRWEGFPLTVIEGMRAGLPTIGSDVGGVREAVEDGQNGFLVPREDPEELSRKVRILLTDAQLRRRMGQEGRRRYESMFTFEKMYERTLEVYKKAMLTR